MVEFYDARACADLPPTAARPAYTVAAPMLRSILRKAGSGDMAASPGREHGGGGHANAAPPLAAAPAPVSTLAAPANPQSTSHLCLHLNPMSTACKSTVCKAVFLRAS